MELDLHLPASRSHKDKRGEVKRLLRRLKGDLQVSAAETGYQDLTQRALVGVAIACADEVTGRKVAADVESIVARVAELQVLDVHTTVVEPEFDGFSMASSDPRLSVDGILLDGAVVETPTDRAGHPDREGDDDWIGPR